MVELEFRTMRGDWNVPLEVELEAVGSYRVISNTEQAAEALVYRWPVQSGARWLRAMQKCLDTLEGKANAEDARKAFIGAAAEAMSAFVRGNEVCQRARPLALGGVKRSGPRPAHTLVKSSL
jgi:hypothetical protein